MNLHGVGVREGAQSCDCTASLADRHFNWGNLQDRCRLLGRANVSANAGKVVWAKGEHRPQWNLVAGGGREGLPRG